MKWKTLVKTWHDLNRQIFDGQLTVPHFSYTQSNWRDGGFTIDNRGRPHMDFSPLDLRGISQARALIYHEMIHQFLDFEMGIDEGAHHGPLFWYYYKIFATGKKLNFRKEKPKFD